LGWPVHLTYEVNTHLGTSIRLGTPRLAGRDFNDLVVIRPRNVIQSVKDELDHVVNITPLTSAVMEMGVYSECRFSVKLVSFHSRPVGVGYSAFPIECLLWSV
jgi:hypothetical protein